MDVGANDPRSSARPGIWRSSWDGPASRSSRSASSRPVYKIERPRTRFRSFFVSDTSDAAARLYVISDNTAVSSSDPNFTGSFGKADRVETVPTITLNDLLDKEGVTAIDFLNMDIELHEPWRSRDSTRRVQAHAGLHRGPDARAAADPRPLRPPWLRRRGKYLRADQENLYFTPLGS